MKKTLGFILALVFVLSLSGTAFAAGPFADVPAKHWAYDAINKLAKAGIIDGYSDGTFHGDRTVTRYEMAQLVGRAIEREDKADSQQKAVIDKLTAEFATELRSLGVRVSTLENKVDNFKIGGNVRVRWVQNYNGNSTFNERVQFNISGKVNDKTSFFARFQPLNYNEMGKTGTSGVPSQTDKSQLTDAAMITKNLFNSDITATYGRFSQRILATGMWADTTGMIDGVKFDTGKALKVTASYANWQPAVDYNGGLGLDGKLGDILYLGANYAPSKATTLYGAYLVSKSGGNTVDVKGIGVNTKVMENLVFSGDYIKNYAYDTNPVGYIARLTYRSYNPSIPGTWDISADYRKFEPNNNFTGIGTAWLSANENTDIKAYMLIADYVPAKNMYINAIYSFNGKKADGSADKPNYFRIQVTSLF